MTRDRVAAPVRRAGPVCRRLRLDLQTATLLGGEGPVEEPVRGLGHGDEEKLWELARSSSRESATPLHRLQLDAGEALGRAFLPPPVAAALAEALAAAERDGRALELGLELADPALADLPWETLRLPAATAEGLPGEPLALHPGVVLYRAEVGAAPAGWVIPGPLRVLVAIGSPEAQNARGELLDMEAELGRILDAVEPARRAAGKSGAHVRILERGTVAAIRAALDRERFHVLHLSCHAGPGVLVLEDGDGREDLVTPERLWREAIPIDRGVPLVVLAGCSTAADVAKVEGDGRGMRRLPGLARELLAHGVPAVVAMQTAVGDRYATALAASLYGALATAEDAEPLRVLSRARRDVEARRRESTAERDVEELAGWSVPVLFRRVGAQVEAAGAPLFDRRAPFEPVEEPAEPTLRRVTARRVGDFVGRRRDERLVLRALRDADGAAVVLRGIGGVGKSTLAAEAAQALARSGSLVAAVVGETSPEGILEEIGGVLFGLLIAAGTDEKHPLRQVASQLRDRSLDWELRQQHVLAGLLAAMPALVLLDNFEDNLDADGAFRNAQLAAFLEGWLETPGRGRLLLTCRYPVPFRGSRVVDHHLGPLSYAETRKLVWRLSALDALKPADLERAYADVGGHPRALEYLDALLRGGDARFTDVAAKLEAALRARGVSNPRAWMTERKGDLAASLAETVTLAADDVLLGRLLAGLAGIPEAERLFLGAAVYRVPVPEAALVWQVGEVPDLPGEDAEVGRFPAVAPPSGYAAARSALEAAGLLAPFAVEDEAEPRFAVHRWTAGALASRSTPADLAEAHRRAARFWRWRVAVWRQSLPRDVEDLLEARHHHRLAAELDAAIEVTEWICSRFDDWGAYRREEQLVHEVLGWLPERSQQAAAFLHQLGIVAQRRGSYDEALGWYRKSLDIAEKLGDRAGMAISYHQLGMVAQHRGSYDEALLWYRKSLDIKEELGNRAGMASSYHQLGNVAQARGSDEEALSWYRKSLEIKEELGNRAGMAISYHQLGMVAHTRHSYDEALDWYRKSLEIAEELEDRAGMASTYHQIGLVAEQRGSYDEALSQYRKSLEIKEELGNRAGMAISYHQLGMVAQRRGSYDEALGWYRKSLEIAEELGSRSGMASSISQIGVLFTEQGAVEEGVPCNLRSLALRLELRVPQIRIDLRVLRRQRKLLGTARFREVIDRHLDAASAEAVLQMIDQLPPENRSTSDTGGASSVE